MKLSNFPSAFKDCTSHPARGAWIEMMTSKPRADGRYVAPREGCVD